jgi:hypothetical protein
MTTKPERDEGFACQSCGSPAVRVNGEVHDQAPVCCLRCGTQICTWSDYRQSISRQIRHISPANLSADPLDTMM